MHMDGSKPTVHMLEWPSSDLTKVDERLEKAMEMVQEIVETVTRERQLKNVKLRWPMKRIVIKVENDDHLPALRSMEEILRSQANVKEVEYVGAGEEWSETILNVVPNPMAIGKVYRQCASKIAVLRQSRSRSPSTIPTRGVPSRARISPAMAVVSSPTGTATSAPRAISKVPSAA